jgi:hypothetical protein
MRYSCEEGGRLYAVFLDREVSVDASVGMMTKKWNAPDWRYPSAYGDPTNWTDRRWAWEFLRRNANYQNIASFIGPAKLQQSVGRRFGRIKLRPYWVEYGVEEESSNVWLVDRIVVEHGWEGGDSKPQSPLADTEIGLKIDLAIIMESGESALNILMKKSRQLCRGKWMSAGAKIVSRKVQFAGQAQVTCFCISV